MGRKEGFDDPNGLSATTGTGLSEDGYFEIVGKPGREALSVALRKVFTDGDKHIIRLPLRESRRAAGQQREGDYQPFEELHFHPDLLHILCRDRTSGKLQNDYLCTEVKAGVKIREIAAWVIAALAVFVALSAADMGSMDRGNTPGGNEGGNGFGMPGGMTPPDFQNGNLTPPDNPDGGSFNPADFPGGNFTPPSGENDSGNP